jgi:hypothetical protein
MAQEKRAAFKRDEAGVYRATIDGVGAWVFRKGRTWWFGYGGSANAYLAISRAAAIQDAVLYAQAQAKRLGRA